MWICAKKAETSRAKNLGQSETFFTVNAKKTFTKLRQVFIEALILIHFDPECYFQIETDVLGYAIGGIFSQLTSDTSGQWHPVAFFFRKMIPAETRYETYDGKFLAIVEAFKTWRHYLKGCKHKVLMLTNQNNLQRFIDTKSLSSRQVQWAQKLSRYYFRIDYQQAKANGTADAFFQYFQQNTEEGKTVRAENTKILHRLQSLLARVLGLSVLKISVLGMK